MTREKGEQPADAPDVEALRHDLLAWFDTHRRDLPWRRTRDPWGVWLSEIMLQQTTVATVSTRWPRFLARYPTVEALAAAPLDDVVAEWSGLGYYARARNLHKAAQRVVSNHAGVIPTTHGALLELPGMGAYTAAAVASIAFGEAVAAVDANVERVVARLAAIDAPIKSTTAKKRVAALAGDWLDRQRPGPWNEAMMELGATVCTMRAPACGQCPVARHCAAARLGTPEAFPVREARAALVATREVAVVLRRGARVLLLKRPDRGSFAGMWELPRGEVLGRESATAAARRIALAQAGLDIEPGAEVCRLAHTVMNRRIELRVLEASGPWAATRREPALLLGTHVEARWVAPGEWLALPCSTTQRHLARLLGGAEKGDIFG